jgi:nicotinamidase-related amidase
MDAYLAPEHPRSALVTIDVQRDTLDGAPLEIPGTSAVLPRIRRLLDAFRARSLPIVHVVRLYAPDGANADLCRRTALASGAPLLLAGSPGSELAEPLLPDPGAKLDAARLLAGGLQELVPREWALYKPRWGAFYRTPLEMHLRALGVTTLVVAGCNFPNCPRTSIYEASERDFRLVAVRDAISGLDEQGAAQLEGIGVAVWDAEHYLKSASPVR